MYDGGLAPRVIGEAGLRERGGEKARRGRGVFNSTSSTSELLLLDEMTEAFRLRSAKLGANDGSGSGVDA